jgi:hypothetical protein
MSELSRIAGRVLTLLSVAHWHSNQNNAHPFTYILQYFRVRYVDSNSINYGIP